jgi:hypothetical protein
MPQLMAAEIPTTLAPAEEKVINTSVRSGWANLGGYLCEYGESSLHHLC